MANNTKFARHATLKPPLPYATWTPGATYNIPLRGLQDDAFGRVGHLAYLRLTVTATLATVAATMGEAADFNYALRLLLQNIKLQAAGHAFLDGVDGLDVEHYYRTVRGNADAFNTGSVPDADGAPTVTFAFEIPFVASPDCRVGRYDRLMPLALFDSDTYPGFLEFTLGSTLAPGVAVTTVDSVELRLVLEYRDRYNQPTDWSLRAIQTQESVKHFKPRGALDYLAIASRANTSADRNHSDYRVRSLKFGGEESLRFPDQTPGDIEGNLFYSWGRGSGEVSQELADSESMVLVAASHYDRRASKMPRGDVRVELSANPSALTTHRYVIADTGMLHDSWNRAFAEALGASGPIEYRSASSRDHALAPLVAQEITWAGAPSQIAASKFGRGRGRR